VRRAAAALALALALPATAASPARAAEKSIWGPVGQVPGHGNAFDLYRRLGVDTYQVSLNFATTAPARPARPRDPGDPAYRWPAELDRAVADGARTGIAVAVQVSRSPRWANGNRPDIWRPDPRHYADFLRAASRRYRSVRRWMIWGEPSRVAVYQPHRSDSKAGARSYAKLLDAAFGALKSVSPRNIVIGGMTFTGAGGETNPARWLSAMKLPGGRPPRLDWYGHNPFSGRFPRIGDRARGGAGVRDICDLDLLSREVARTYRRIGRRPKLWLSEYTIPSDHGSKVFSLYVSRRGQAQWLAAAFRLANALPSVAGIGWLGLQDEPESNLSTTFGLITAKGERKPAFSAYRSAPSRAFRPAVRAARRLSLRALATRGLSVVVRTRARGSIKVTLAGRNGRPRVRRILRSSAVRAPKRVILRSARLARGRYTLVVDAPRGERVRRRVVVD
jgi:hypothetical protein